MQEDLTKSKNTTLLNIFTSIFLPKSKFHIILYILLMLEIPLLFLYCNEISISRHEARLLFEHGDMLIIKLAKISMYIFGQNDSALRTPFIIAHIVATLLIFHYSKLIHKKESDSFITTIIYMLLPAVFGASVLVTKSTFIIILTMLFLIMHREKERYAYYLLPIYLFVDNSFAILFLALFFYAILKENGKLLLASMLTFGTSMAMYGFFDESMTSGHHLMALISIYTASLSPFVFLYLLYIVYRKFTKEYDSELDFILVITAFFLSIMFSLKEQVFYEDFVPYVVAYMPHIGKFFFHGYRVRLPEFRKGYKILFSITFLFLLSTSAILIINKTWYQFIDNPKKHFAFHHHIAKELAILLNRNGIDKIQTPDNKYLVYRLMFYGIKAGDKYIITKNRVNDKSIKLDVRYTGRSVMKYYATKNRFIFKEISIQPK